MYDKNEINYSDLTLSAHYQPVLTEGRFNLLAEHYCEEKYREKIIALISTCVKKKIEQERERVKKKTSRKKRRKID